MDWIVIGGGVLGTFHAYHAILNGLRVALLERDELPRSASVRNFGQVVPSGMDSRWQEFGRSSLEIYKEIQSRIDITVRQHGSVYLASDEEEEQLLVELSELNQKNGYPSQLLSRKECLRRYPTLREDYVQAGLYFPEEVTVEPREMVFRLQQFLRQSHGLEVRYRCPAIECRENKQRVEVTIASGERLYAERVMVCTGSDFKELFPDRYANSDLEIAKIQMMETGPQHNLELKGSILTGWSIRRYEAFRECPSYPSIKSGEAVDSAQKRWGVHLLFKQAVDGSVIIGDSHEYTDASRPDALGFDLNMEIDDFILREARKIFDLPNYKIRRRWFGLYSQCKSRDIFLERIGERIHIVTGIGGKGMTGGPGFARHHISTLIN